MHNTALDKMHPKINLLKTWVSKLWTEIPGYLEFRMGPLGDTDVPKLPSHYEQFNKGKKNKVNPIFRCLQETSEWSEQTQTQS